MGYSGENQDDGPKAYGSGCLGRSKAQKEKQQEKIYIAAGLILLTLAVLAAAVLPFNLLEIWHNSGKVTLFRGSEHTAELCLNLSDPMSGLVPEEYALVYTLFIQDTSYLTIYEDRNGNQISLSIDSAEALVAMDTEDAQVIENRTIAGHRAVIAMEEKDVSILWVDENRQVILMLVTKDLTCEEAIELAENVQSLIDG